ncbi:hypothetical protein CHF27_002195 [Romboutsia maritimum]|uniref:Uncharacterized protein n=1 Tax=Romboutsia maritimum TaxID=2020948 RepID=A0A371IVG1_9FIRM|nr:M23 family metallopeptidase [Romboutsia maritimum]RDY24470.1 hypothetical protein CHF27_002195 [Romboutsia maritimum]
MKKVISLITACAVLFSTTFIFADDKDNLDNKLEQNKAAQSSLEKDIQSLNESIKEIETNIQDTNNQISKLDTEITKTKEEITQLQSKIQKNENDLGKRLKAINSNYSLGYIKVILSSSSISELFDNIYIVKQVVNQDKTTLKELDNNKVSIEAKELEQKEKKEKQQQLKDVLEQDYNKVKEKKAKFEELKKQLQKEADDLEGEVAKLAQQNSQVVEEGAVISNGSWPVPGHTRISSPYGNRPDPILNTQSFHTGIDIPAPEGTPAVAVDDGEVIFSGVKGSYGNTLMIKHNDGKVSLYAHNSKLVASVGTKVKKGQTVTRIGTTGRSTGPHLHFEIRINGSHTNPMNYL